jgi:predicted NBD/HSP70 family sugar kinase
MKTRAKNKNGLVRMVESKKPVEPGGAIVDGSRIEDARTFNRRLVFETIFQRGPISRVEIASLVGLRPQTISSITRELIEQDLIVEAGRSSGLRGQPQIYLEPNAQAGYSVGVHLDRNFCVLVVCDLKRTELVRRELTFDTTDPRNTLARIAGAIDEALVVAKAPRDRVWGVGLVLPTFGSDVYDFNFAMPHWEAWRNVSFAEDLRALCGLPVLVENDATAAAIGERFHRQDITNAIFAYFYIGHGTGCGLIIDGVPFKGFGGNAGEAGLLPVFGLDGSPVWPDLQTTDVLSLRGIATALAIDESDLTIEMIARLHTVRDHRLMEWVARAASALRDVVAVIEVMFDPEFIVAGGSLPRQLVESLVDRAYPLRPTPAARRDRLRPRLSAAELVEDAAASGGAMLPIFVNTSPNFRHLYVRQIPRDERPFDLVASEAGGHER